MSGGDARAAFGVNLMREEFETPGNQDAANGKITQQGGSWFDGSRTISAVFGEAIFPLAKNFEVNTAARIDKYPNFSANIAPKIGVTYRPVSDLLVRSTYSQGFPSTEFGRVWRRWCICTAWRHARQGAL